MEYASAIGIEYLRELVRNDIPISGIVCVGSEYHPKNDQLLLERTGGNYVRPNFAGILQDSHIQMYIVEDINGSYCSEILNKLNPELIVMESTRIIHSPIYKINPCIIEESKFKSKSHMIGAALNLKRK